MGTTDNKMGDLTGKNRTPDDYDYDPNGHMLYIKNKPISNIIYNRHNLPQQVVAREREYLKCLQCHRQQT